MFLGSQPRPNFQANKWPFEAPSPTSLRADCPVSSLFPFMDTCDDTGLTQITQDNLPMEGQLTDNLNSIWNLTFPLPYNITHWEVLEIRTWTFLGWEGGHYSAYHGQLVTWKVFSGPARAGGGWELIEAGRVTTRMAVSTTVRVERWTEIKISRDQGKNWAISCQNWKTDQGQQ